MFLYFAAYLWGDRNFSSFPFHISLFLNISCPSPSEDIVIFCFFSGQLDIFTLGRETRGSVFPPDKYFCQKCSHKHICFQHTNAKTKWTPQAANHAPLGKDGCFYPEIQPPQPWPHTTDSKTSQGALGTSRSPAWLCPWHVSLWGGSDRGKLILLKCHCHKLTTARDSSLSTALHIHHHTGKLRMNWSKFYSKCSLSELHR